APQDLAVAANGDIYVTDGFPFGGTQRGALVRVNPVTGAQTLVASDGLLTGAQDMGITFDGAGQVLLTTQITSRVVRINPATGAQSLVTSGNLIANPVGIAVAPNGDILVSDQNAFGGPGGIIRVNSATGAQ